MSIPSPLVTLRDHILTLPAITSLVGADGVIVGAVTPALKDMMPRKLVQLLPGGTFENSPEYPYWKVRVQVNAYDKTPYGAHRISLILIESLQGVNEVIVEAVDHSEGVRARITDIEHVGGPMPLVDEHMQNAQLEVTFWSVGAIRAET